MPDQNPSLSRRSLTSLGRGLLLALGLLAAPLTQANEQLFSGALKGLAPGLRPSAQPRYATRAEYDGRTEVSADFFSLRGEPLSLQFTIEQAASQASMQGFGISQDEIDALRQACISNRACSQEEFDQRLAAYYREHKLRLRSVPGGRPHLYVDIPEVVRRNQDAVRPVSAALHRLGLEQGRDSTWVFEAALGLVQAAMAYRTPAQQLDGRQTLGFYTPPQALEKGYGDCDTKSALLAAILGNLGDTRMIGVRVPNHYLLGVARQPRPGEAFVEYRGEPFVLVEAAGPAQRPPGDIAHRTRQALERGEELRIDPMF